MSDQDLSKVFGESGAASFGDLNKVASPAPRPETTKNHDSDVADNLDVEIEDEYLSKVEDSDVETSTDVLDDAFGQTSYVLPEVIRHMAVVRKRMKKTNADLVMDALDFYVQRGQMAKLIARRQTGPGRPKGSLFPSRRVRGRAAADGKSRKLWTFQATKEEEAIMENLVEEYGANSMSELVAVVVESRYKPKR